METSEDHSEIPNCWNNFYCLVGKIEKYFLVEKITIILNFTCVKLIDKIFEKNV